MGSIFTKIIQGEIPAYKVAENEEFVAFLDIFPQVPGHMLVVPKTEIDRIWDLPNDLLSKYLLFAKPIAEALERCFDCERCAINVIGLDVPHAHMHLLPIRKASDMHPKVGRAKVSEAEFKEMQARIIAELKTGSNS